MIKTKFVKALMLGVCLSAFSTGLALAGTVENKAAEVAAQDTVTDSDLAELQKEIDQYVFTDHFDEFQKLGFTVTYTGPVDNYVEIGITPYSDENAAYLYDIFGKDSVKVVKGEEVMLYTTMEAAPDSLASSEAVDEKLLDKQDEVNKILFQDKINELEGKEIGIMHTAPVDGAVEVGILPYTEENIDYIYSILGKDMVNVVEGKEPELMATSGIATDNMVTDTAVDEEALDTGKEGNIDVAKVTANAPAEEESAGKKDNILPIAGIAGVVVLLGGAVIISQKKKITK